MAEAISLKQVYEELKKIEKKMATKQEVQALLETIDVMGNPDTMRQIAESTDDIKQGRVKEVSGIKDLLAEMK